MNNPYRGTTEANETPPVANVTTSTGNNSDNDKAKETAPPGIIDAYAESKKSSWHVNLPIQSKASVMMIRAQVLQNKGDEKTISEVISEAIDFYYHHIIKE